MQLDPHMLIADVVCTADHVLLTLADGRLVGAPLAWFPRLEAATSDQRRNWQLSDEGNVVHWPALDETISVHRLAGHPGAAPFLSVRHLPAPI